MIIICICRYHTILLHTQTYCYPYTYTTAQLDLVFDKDNDWAMRTVLTLSNIRSHIFHIPLQSYHDGKGIAGNIIPAIATTNAIIAAAQVWCFVLYGV